MVDQMDSKDSNTKTKLSALELPEESDSTTTVEIGTKPFGTLHRAAYTALFALFLAQLVAILNNHSHLGGLTMFDTVILLIIKADTVDLHRLLFPGKNVAKSELAPLLLIVACIVFEALIFVNFTHAIEAITCADSSSHFSAPFLATVGLNIMIKSPILYWSRELSVSGISLSCRYFLHFGASLGTVSLAIANQYFSPETDKFISCLDRYLGAGMCVLLSIVVFPLFKQNVPYLLCDVPEGAREDQLRAEIEQKFPNVRCTHLHIYIKWPGHKFDAFLHVTIDELFVNYSNDTSQSEQALQQLMHALQLLLRGKGARRVAIQPWLSVHGEQPRGQQQLLLQDDKTLNKFNMCISEQCLHENKSCCREEKGKIGPKA
uniref:Uncharacterized protein n=1 Tax=Globodera rostochiensis TaxID=31243 RepID=A0A914H0R0_GLORO